MTGRRLGLMALMACLRGEMPAQVDWTAVIALANRSWLTPALFGALSGASLLGRVPGDARDYLAFIHERNLQRNRRLRDQLFEAVAALNGAGVEPVLTKGTLCLFVDDDARLGLRMMSDLDLQIERHEVEVSTACLRDLGYEDLSACGVSGFGRPQDAGVLEIHCRSDPASAPVWDHLDADTRTARCGKLNAKAQSATARALHLVEHDQIKEGDYWRGAIDLRHLNDLAELTRSNEGVDWHLLLSAAPDRLHRHAFGSQILIAQRLFGIAVPNVRVGAVTRFQYWRVMVQLGFPRAAIPLRWAGNIAWMLRRVRIRDVPGWSGRGLLPQLARLFRKFRQGRHATFLAFVGPHRGPKL